MRDLSSSWCINNGITIYPIIWREANPENPPRLAIQVNYQGFKRTGDMIWSQRNKKENLAMYERIADLYKYYYNRDK